MAAVIDDDIARMRSQLFIEGDEARTRLSRFWMLLVLAGIIATAGVVGDSTATVIGAMIVAPLMTPILGIVLAIVLGDRVNLLRSIALVIAGAAAVVAIGWLVGNVVTIPVLEATNSQVAARVHPRLIDLLAALATGVVGSFALIRSDISDTLPGVAIAISLVPPLAVVGLTLESGSGAQAAGALLLFVTNVAAILATGVVVMAVAGVHRFGPPDGSLNRINAVLVVVALIVIVVIPLGASTAVIGRDTLNEQRVARSADAWTAASGWQVIGVRTDEGSVVVRASGPGQEPDPDDLRRQLDADGLTSVDVRVELVPETRVDLPGH